MRGRGGDKPSVAIATMNGRDSIRGELEVGGVFLASLRAKIKTTYQMEHDAQDAHMTWCVQREGIDGGGENTKASNTKNMYARARSGDSCSGTWCLLGLGKGHVVCGTHTLLRRELLNDHDDIFRRKRTFKIDVR